MADHGRAVGVGDDALGDVGRASWALTSGTTSGHVGVHAPGRRVVDRRWRRRRRPAGASSGDAVGAGGEQGDVEAGEVGGGGVLDGDLARPSTAGCGRPSGPRRRSGARRRGRPARRASRRMTPPTWPVAPKIPTRMGPRLRAVADGPIRCESASGASSPKAVCRAPTACSRSSSATTQVMRMAEVEIISMLMPSRGQRLEHGGGHAGVRLHARADEAHPGDGGVGGDAGGADLGGERARRPSMASVEVVAGAR